MRIFVTGGTGLLGRSLVGALSARDHTLTVLTRDPVRNKWLTVNPRTWLEQGDPTRSGGWQRSVDGADAVIHLAGASPVERELTASRVAELVAVREAATRELVRAVGEASKKPRVVLVASSVGFYGEPKQEVDERAPAGAGELADMCQKWEVAALPLCDSAVVVTLRFGQLVGPKSVFDKVKRPGDLPPADDTALSWVHVEDAARIAMSMLNARMSTPVNVTTPHPATVASLHRAYGFPVEKKGVLSRMFGSKRDVGTPIQLLSGPRVRPATALSLGYSFRYEKIEQALGR